MTNLVQDYIVGFNKQANEELDDVEFHLPPEPHMDYPKNYKTKTGHKAVVQDNSGYDLVLIIKGGLTVDKVERPF